VASVPSIASTRNRGRTFLPPAGVCYRNTRWRTDDGAAAPTSGPRTARHVYAANLVRLTVLGSGTIVPSLRRRPSAYLLEAGGLKILLDCGSGCLHRLLEAGAHPDDIDLMLFSHTHIDHTSELPLFLFSARYAPQTRRRALRIAGSAGFVELFAALERLYGDWISASMYERRLETLADGGEMRAGGVRIRAAAARHIPSSLALRIEEAGTSLVYTGDTEYSVSVVDLARGCDLLLCECSFADGASCPGHLTPSEAGRIAAEAGARRLLLTHFYPACEEVDRTAQARRTYSGELLLAEDLLQVSVEKAV
jgi:ribonuclease BN (tRNA processing enzyme)